MNGWKTYASGAVAIAIGVAALVGVDVSSLGVTPDNAAGSIWAGLSLIFLRRGVAKTDK